MKLGFDTSVSSQDVVFGPYNILECRPDQIMSFPMNTQIMRKGMVMATHIYPYSGGAAAQTIFSLRNAVTNYVSMQIYFTNTGYLNIWMNPTSGSYSAFSPNAPTPLNLGDRNTIIVVLNCKSRQLESTYR